MLVISFKLPEGEPRGPIMVILILEKENLDRMDKADPLDIHFSAYRNQMQTERPIRELDFIIAHEEDTNQILQFKKSNDLRGFMRWLERGREIKAGDLHPPVPFRKN